jgi:hypothetical protein
MKVLFTVVLVIFTLTSFSQKADIIDTPSNSFESQYRITNPTLIYSYDTINKIHNYSNNWDFDNDGIKDELYFVGTGGAHLYYFLKVVLSTDHTPREFSIMLSDYPMLTSTDTLNLNKTPFGFVVANLDKNLIPTIIVRLGDKTFCDCKQPKKTKIRTNNISLHFENGKPIYGCL